VDKNIEKISIIFLYLNKIKVDFQRFFRLKKILFFKIISNRFALIDEENYYEENIIVYFTSLNGI
jgi:hypothetical protein